MINPKITHNAKYQQETRRELRLHGTPAEAALWTLLKGRQVNNLRWRRQFSIETYILDFYCPTDDDNCDRNTFICGSKSFKKPTKYSDAVIKYCSRVGLFFISSNAHA